MSNKNKTRVVAYARVSTDSEDQINSLENQKSYFQRELNRNNDCCLVDISIPNICEKGVYYDRGRSGTKIHRPAFDALLKDSGLEAIVDADTNAETTHYKIARKPKFDVIWVKDTSRFARNVSINIILRTLRENGVYVHFLDIDKGTEDEADFTAIQLFLTLAERESTDKSQKVKFGYEEGIKNGKIYFGGKMIGYDYDSAENKLTVNKKEAELVKTVFNLYTEDGLGEYRICSRLSDLGFFNNKGNKYTRSTIRRMLTNEKYCGVTNSGIYHKVDVFSGKRIKRDYNDQLRVEARKAQEELLKQGIIKIEPIISVEQYKKAQAIRKRNAEIYKLDGSWHGTTDYSKKVVCKQCGAFYRAQGTKVNAKGESITYYVCKHRTDYDEKHGVDKCANPSIKVSELDNAVLNGFFIIEKWYLKMLHASIPKIIEHLNSLKDTESIKEAERINCEIKENSSMYENLKDSYLRGIFPEDEFIVTKEKIEKEIDTLKSKADFLLRKKNYIDSIISQLSEIADNCFSEIIELESHIKNKDQEIVDKKKILRDIDRIIVNEDGTVEIVTKVSAMINEMFQEFDIEPLSFDNAWAIKQEIIEKKHMKERK